MNTKELTSMKDKTEKKYKIKVYCSKCSKKKSLLLESVDMTREEISDSWVRMVMSAPLNTPRCPKCKHSTFSDCNSAIDFYIQDLKSNRQMNSKTFFK